MERKGGSAPVLAMQALTRAQGLCELPNSLTIRTKQLHG